MVLNICYIYFGQAACAVVAYTLKMFAFYKKKGQFLTNP